MSSASASTAATVSPACLFSIFDQFQRRSELCTGRLIGAIYGTRVEGSAEEAEGEVISIKQAFPIPHSELNEQVSINNEFYKNRAELIRTCYGKSQYILGWYSIRLSSSSQPTPSCTAFIHDVFSKEINKSSPIAAPNAALHLEIVVDVETAAIAVKLWTGAGAEQCVCADCPVAYAPEDAALLARNDTVNWKDLIATASTELSARLPQKEAYAAGVEKFKTDLGGFSELVEVLVDELHKAQQFYLN